MSTSETIFLTVGGVGFVFLLMSFLLGEAMEIGHEFEIHAPEAGAEHPEAGISHGDASYVPTWFSTKVLCAMMVGLGAAGFTASYYGAAALLAWPLAILGAIGLGLITLQFVLKPLARQQSNSLIGRQSYVGGRGQVILPIPSDGYGQVSFRDSRGARVFERATSADGALTRGSRIMIIDITPTSVVVSNDPLSAEEN